MGKIVKNYAAGVALFFAASAVQAVTTTGTFSAATGTGNFDLSNLLSAESFVSGTATFSFHDLSSYSLTSSTQTNSGSYNSSYVNTTTTNNYFNPLDQATVSIAGQTATASNGANYSSTSSSSSSSSNYSYVAYYYPQPYTYYWTESYSCGWNSTCYRQQSSTTYYNQPVYATGTSTNTTITNQSGYTGDFYVSVLLGPEVNSNIQNGSLPFSFSFNSGSAQMTGVSLEYSTLVSAVPEPETYAMLLAGLGVIGVAAHRKNRVRSLLRADFALAV